MPFTSPPCDSPVFREVVFADEEPDKPLDACFLVLVFLLLSTLSSEEEALA